MFKKINFSRVAPSFIIIGVQKGGTSSLYYYLSQHPGLLVPNTKELHYFDTQAPTPKRGYLKLFPKSYGTQKESFEATPRYMYYPGTAKKIYDFNPNMKFIVMLRNPVDRAYSAWNMYRQLATNEKVVENARTLNLKNSREKQYEYLFKNRFPSFKSCIELELNAEFDQNTIEPSLVRRGYYKEQVEAYLRCFPKKSFLFLNFDEFKANTVASLDEVATFLNISKFKGLDLDLKPKNKRKYKNPISNDLYRFLLMHYQEKNKGLESLTGLTLSWMH